MEEDKKSGKSGSFGDLWRGPENFGYLRNLVGLHLSIPFKLRSDFFCFGGIAYYFWWDLT